LDQIRKAGTIAMHNRAIARKGEIFKTSARKNNEQEYKKSDLRDREKQLDCCELKSKG